MSNHKLPPIEVPTMVLNAYMVDTWLRIIEDSGYTTHIQFVPSITNRPIYGFPPGFVEGIVADDRPADQIFGKKNKKNRKKGRGYVCHGEMAYASVPLNVSVGRAARFCTVSTNSGYIHMDIRINGVACQNIQIPIECIIDVYAKEYSTLSSHRLGWPVSGSNHLISLDADRDIVIQEFGSVHDGEEPVERAKTKRPMLSLVGAASSEGVQAEPEPEVEAAQPVEAPKHVPDAIVDENACRVFDMRSARQRLRSSSEDE